jgi:hypothetical protein
MSYPIREAMRPELSAAPDHIVTGEVGSRMEQISIL